MGHPLGLRGKLDTMSLWWGWGEAVSRLGHGTSPTLEDPF